jgi:hypothetical protein
VSGGARGTQAPQVNRKKQPAAGAPRALGPQPGPPWPTAAQPGALTGTRSHRQSRTCAAHASWPAPPPLSGTSARPRARPRCRSVRGARKGQAVVGRGGFGDGGAWVARGEASRGRAGAECHRAGACGWGACGMPPRRGALKRGCGPPAGCEGRGGVMHGWLGAFCRRATPWQAAVDGAVRRRPCRPVLQALRPAWPGRRAAVFGALPPRAARPWRCRQVPASRPRRAPAMPPSSHAPPPAGARRS